MNHPGENSRIIGLGETVFDIIFNGMHPSAAKPGGSAFNALITLGRLGVPGRFISEVGNDRLGHHIREFLTKNGVDADHVVLYESGKSAISLAFLDEGGDAEYDFYKDYPNQRLSGPFPKFGSGDYLLFGSFYGLNPAIRPQVESILNLAAEGRSLIYYDPNFRAGHAESIDELLPIIEDNFKRASLVRASSEDIQNIYGTTDPEIAWKKLQRFVEIFIFTANSEGVYFYSKEYSFHLKVEQIDPVSTIGAGDTFNAAVLYGLYRRGINRESLFGTGESEWRSILKDAAVFSREVCLSYENYLDLEFARKYRIG